MGVLPKTDPPSPRSAAFTSTTDSPSWFWCSQSDSQDACLIFREGQPNSQHPNLHRRDQCITLVGFELRSVKGKALIARLHSNPNCLPVRRDNTPHGLHPALKLKSSALLGSFFSVLTSITLSIPSSSIVPFAAHVLSLVAYMILPSGDSAVPTTSPPSVKEPMY